MTTKKATNYQALSDELDGILAQLQGGELDIDKATAQYERGMAIVQQLQAYLKTAQNKVTRIKAKFDTSN